MYPGQIASCRQEKRADQSSPSSFRLRSRLRGYTVVGTFLLCLLVANADEPSRTIARSSSRVFPGDRSEVSNASVDIRAATHAGAAPPVSFRRLHQIPAVARSGTARIQAGAPLSDLWEDPLFAQNEIRLAEAGAALRASPSLVYSENFDGPEWSLGDANQNGWGALATPRVSISGALPYSSPRSLEFHPSGTPSFQTMANSPVFWNYSPDAALTLRIRMNTSGGPDYFITPQDVDAALIVTRVDLDWQRNILVLTPDGGGPGTPGWLDTGANWAVGQYFTLGFEVDNSSSRVHIMVNGVEIFVADTFANVISNIVFQTDNYTPDIAMYVDDIQVDACTPTAPGTPSDGGDCTSSPTVTVCWTAASDPECGIASYYLEVGTSPGAMDVDYGNVGNVLCYQFNDVSAYHGQSLYARVLAINGVGNIGRFSDNSDGILIDLTLPGQPLAPIDEGDCTASTTAAFYWTAVDDPESGIDGYNLQVGTSPGAGDRFSGNVGIVLQYSVVGVAGDTLYARVQAVNGCAAPGLWSGSSDGILIESNAPTAPGRPVTPDLAGPYSTSPDVRYEWTPASAPSGINSYNLQVGTYPAGDNVFDANVGNVLTYTVTGGQGQTLYARVQAVSTGGCSTGAFSEVSNPVTIDLTPPTAPGPPAAPTGCTSSANLTFEWSPATDPQSGIDYYHLQVGSVLNGNDVFDGNVGNVTEYTLSTTGHHGDTLYARVRALNNAGLPPGEWSVSSLGVLVDITPPTSPSAPVDAGETTTSPIVRFSWNPANDPESGISSYNLQVGKTPGANDVFDANVGDVLTKLVYGADGQTLYARVQAVNGCGTAGAFSANSDGITIDTSAILIEYQPVLVSTQTSCAGARTTSLPQSLSAVAPGETFFLELWATQVGPPLAGLTCVYTDAAWNASCVSPYGASPITHLSCPPDLDFSYFTSGSTSPGLADEVGGCTLDPDVGVSPEWVLVAAVAMIAEADCAGTLTQVELQQADTPSTARAVEGPPYNFTVPPNQIIYNFLDLNITGEPDIRVEPTTLDFTGCLPTTAVLTVGAGHPDNEIRLKRRRFVPPVGLAPVLTSADQDELQAPRHILVQLKDKPTAQDKATLEATGIQFVSYVSPKVFTVRATAAQLSEGPVLRLIRWAGPLEAEDKISRSLDLRPAESGADRKTRTLLVQLHQDVPAMEASGVLARIGVLSVREGYIQHTFMLVKAHDLQAKALAAADQVAWLTEAPAALAAGEQVYICPGGLTAFGPVANYATNGEGWDGPGRNAFALGYFFDNGTTDLLGDSEQAECIGAMNEWSRHVAITWEPYPDDSDESVDIGWYVGDHGDGYPFDGPGRVIAHTFYPADINPEPIAGDMHFDDDETFEVGDPGPGFDQFSIALHELGHSLGLAHSDDPTAVMYPSISESTVWTQLAADDIAGILSLYATAPGAFVIFNDGPGTLNVTSISKRDGNSWLTISPSTPYAIPPAGAQTVTVTIDWNNPALTPGSNDEQLLVWSDDADENPYPNAVYVNVTATDCNDGLYCNGPEQCVDGVCVAGAPPDCSHLDDQCNTGVCDEDLNACVKDPTPHEGDSCDDGDRCTQTDRCQAGVCEGSNPVVCTPLDQCHYAGTCDPNTGVCTNPAKPDDTLCDLDGLFCTADTCQSGACTGGVDPCPGPDGDGDCAESCDEEADNCLATDPNGAPCDGGTCTCQTGVCECCCCSTPEDGECCQLFGDVVGTFMVPNPGSNCSIDFFDIRCELNGFAAGAFWPDACPHGDLVGNSAVACGGNGTINFFDIRASLNAFAGAFPCLHPCAPENACGAPGSPSPLTNTEGGALSRRPLAELFIETSAKRIRPGGSVSVDVYIGEIFDLSGYQVAMDQAGGRRGALFLEDASVDTVRVDYVFGNKEGVSATDPPGGRVVNVLLFGGVRVDGRGYLATFVFRASADAAGIFQVAVRPEGTLLGDSTDQHIDLALVPSAMVEISSRRPDRRKLIKE